MNKIPFLALLISFGLSSCNQNESERISPINSKWKYGIETPNLNIFFDARMEILYIFGEYSDYFLINNYEDYAYRDSVHAHFDEYADHEAITFYKQLVDSGFQYDAQPTLILSLTDSLTFRKNSSFDLFEERIGGVENAEKLTALIQKFYVDTDFESFFYRMRPIYDRVIVEIREGTEDGKGLSVLEDYYGKKQASYNIVPLMLGTGNFGPRIELDEGYFEVYDFHSALKLGGVEGLFAGKAMFEDVLQHEFSHSFVAQLTHPKGDSLMDYLDTLYAPIQSQMEKLAYTKWSIAADEHLIRAISNRLVRQLKGEEEAYFHRLGEISMGFVYLDALTHALEEYEQNRDKYPVFDDFFPVILKTWEQLEAFEGKFYPTIRSSLPDRVVYSDKEADTLSLDSLHRRFDPWGRYEATMDTLDLENLRVIVMGTSEGSEVLKEALNATPIKIGSGEIRTDIVIKGDSLRVLFSLPHTNSELGGNLYYVGHHLSSLVKRPSVRSLFNITPFFINYHWAVFDEKDSLVRLGFFEEREDGSLTMIGKKP